MLLSWEPGSDDHGIDHYVLSQDGLDVATLLPQATRQDRYGLVPESSYSFAIRAVDGTGNEGPALAASVTLPAAVLPSWPAWFAMDQSEPRLHQIPIWFTPASGDPGDLTYTVKLDGAVILTSTVDRSRTGFDCATPPGRRLLPEPRRAARRAALRTEQPVLPFSAGELSLLERPMPPSASRLRRRRRLHPRPLPGQHLRPPTLRVPLRARARAPGALLGSRPSASR